MLINLLFESPVVFVLVALALIVSISVHEFAHAFVADKFGDPTPKAVGRVTLNPRAHLDPFGTIMLLVAGFGWGKPVPFNPMYLKNPKRDSALISFAGPFSNFLLAALMSVFLKFIVNRGGLLDSFLYLVVFYNLILGFFNLIPLHPLDGFKVVGGLLPMHLADQWMQTAPYGIYVLLLLVLTNSISKLLNPLIDFSLRVLGLYWL